MNNAKTLIFSQFGICADDMGDICTESMGNICSDDMVIFISSSTCKCYYLKFMWFQARLFILIYFIHHSISELLWKNHVLLTTQTVCQNMVSSMSFPLVFPQLVSCSESSTQESVRSFCVERHCYQSVPVGCAASYYL